MIGETKYHTKSGIINSTSGSSSSGVSSNTTTNTNSGNMLVGPQKYAKAASIYNATNSIIHTNGGVVGLNTTSSSINSKELDASFSKISLSSHHHHHGTTTTNNTSSNNNNNNVKFIGFFDKQIDEREKYLTAKYPNHQMALIKKRLKVEFWIDEQLKCLFKDSDNSKQQPQQQDSDQDQDDEYDICADDLVDTLLDLDTDHERKFHILNQLRGAKRNKEEVLKFVDELLVKLRML